jgi:hypothetical protein
VLVLALLLAGAGCSGQKRLTINGSLSYEGHPVASAMVKFYSQDHVEMAYVRDGSFTITDVPPGEVKVAVEPDPSGGKSVAIPQKYTDPETSGLAFTITPKTRDLPIQLD